VYSLASIIAELLKKIPEDCKAPVKKCGGKKDNAQWAGLTYFTHMPVKTFVTQQLVETQTLEPDGENMPQDAKEKPSLYIHDWSLPLYCKELVTTLKIPKWFSADFLQVTPPRTRLLSQSHHHRHYRH
jgi:hypothetical protein